MKALVMTREQKIQMRAEMKNDWRRSRRIRVVFYFHLREMML
jgi:hypothetical protein